MNGETISLVILPALTAFILFAVFAMARIRFHRWRMSRVLSGVMDGGRFRMKGILFSARLLGRFNGQDASLYYSPAWWWKAGTFFTEAACRAPWDFRIQRQTRTRRLRRALGMTRAVASGDPELDKLFSFWTASPERLARWLAQPGVRAEVSRLLLSGSAISLYLGRGRYIQERALAAYYSYMVPIREEGNIRGILTGLESLARSLETMD